jgi:hypothetical protein
MTAKKILAIFSVMLSTCIALSFSSNEKSGQTEVCRKKIYISGKVTFKEDKEVVEGATVGIKGTNVYCVANNKGFYQIDITEIADTSDTLVVLATYVQCRLMEVYVNYKIKKSIVLNMELSLGARSDSEKIILEKKAIRKQ